MDVAVRSLKMSPWTRQPASGSRPDTVPYGAFRPHAFRMAGRFDETLVRNQDDEFNLRLRRAGGRIVFDPAIRVYYTPRGSLRRLFRQYYEYGRWKAPVMRKHGRPTSAQPRAGGFIGSMLVLAVLAIWANAAFVALDVELALYVGGALVFGFVCLRRRHESLRLLPRCSRSSRPCTSRTGWACSSAGCAPGPSPGPRRRGVAAP